uniref:Uncharacterized protein n=1 Tax=Aegilops tauschii subsp. strangulata TaxID=200361 RepID=A0A453KN25_AEGTS
MAGAGDGDHGRLMTAPQVHKVLAPLHRHDQHQRCVFPSPVAFGVSVHFSPVRCLSSSHTTFICLFLFPVDVTSPRSGCTMILDRAQVAPIGEQVWCGFMVGVEEQGAGEGVGHHCLPLLTSRRAPSPT